MRGITRAAGTGDREVRRVERRGVAVRVGMRGSAGVACSERCEAVAWLVVTDVAGRTVKGCVVGRNAALRTGDEAGSRRGGCPCWEAEAADCQIGVGAATWARSGAGGVRGMAGARGLTCGAGFANVRAAASVSIASSMEVNRSSRRFAVMRSITFARCCGTSGLTASARGSERLSLATQSIHRPMPAGKEPRSRHWHRKKCCHCPPRPTS